MPGGNGPVARITGCDCIADGQAEVGGMNITGPHRIAIHGRVVPAGCLALGIKRLGEGTADGIDQIDPLMIQRFDPLDDVLQGLLNREHGAHLSPQSAT